MDNPVSAVRTQIYLPHDLHQEVVARARKENTSMSEIIRQAITRTIAKTTKTGKPKNDLLKYAGIIKDETATDISKNSAKYLKQMYEERFP